LPRPRRRFDSCEATDVSSWAVCSENPNSDVMVMKAAEDRVRINDSDPLNRARDRSIFVQRPVRSDVVIVTSIVSQDSAQMRLAQRRIDPTSRSAKPFCQGEADAVRLPAQRRGQYPTRRMLGPREAQILRGAAGPRFACRSRGAAAHCRALCNRDNHPGPDGRLEHGTARRLRGSAWAVGFLQTRKGICLAHILCLNRKDTTKYRSNIETKIDGITSKLT
jgi:hypothetical protein